MTNLVKFTPFHDLDRLFEDEPFLPMFSRAPMPAADLYETDDEVVAEVSIPGLDPKDVAVEIENNILHVRGQRQSQDEDKGRGYYRREVRRGVFARAIALPAEVDADKVTASYQHGILKVAMPKSERAKPRKVSVEVK